MTFAGVALQKAQVRYTIKRRPRFFGWSTMWSAQTSVVAKDTIQTNEKGEFTIPVHLLLPLKKREKESRYYSSISKLRLLAWQEKRKKDLFLFL